MKNRCKKNIIFILLLFLLLICFSSVFAQTELEIKYEDIPGAPAPTAKGGLPNYIKYIFNYMIAGAGLTALWYLLEAGVRYLTSAGDEEKTKDAKKQISAVFKGTILLLFSYLILITINPQLISFELPGLTQIPEAQLPQTPISPLATSDLLGRIKEMTKTIRKIPDEINSMAERIQELTNKCDCANTQSLCFCDGGSESNSCQPRSCYAGSGFQPCPDESEIKENQKRVIVWKDEMLYYRNRVLAEVEDLRDSIEEILNEEISWYNQKITAEQELLAGIQDDVGKEQQQKLINYLTEQRDWLIEERDYKENLKQTLNELADLIKQIEPFISEIGTLPDKCLYDEGVYGINNKCQASCKQGKEYGCHDAKEGCQPDECSGGNPCPVGEINDQLLLIQGLRPQIINKCDEIINIINNIKETKEKKFQL